MYRKYTLTKTHVINTYNYLLQTTQIQTQQTCLFHQILISTEQLPSLIDQRAIQDNMEQSENQNIISENRANYQFYIDQNLLQIKIKPKAALITAIHSKTLKQHLKIVNCINLDCIIAIKQLISNSKQKVSICQRNNASKFYSLMVQRGQWKQCIIPFLLEDKIHYYDLYFNNFYQKTDTTFIQDKTLKNRLAKKGKLRDMAKDTQILSDCEIFNKYTAFLILLLTSSSIVELLQDLKKLALSMPAKQQLNNKIQKIRNNNAGKLQKGLPELLQRCINHPEQFNLNIFSKECELLLERCQKLQQRVSNQNYDDTIIKEVAQTYQHQHKIKQSKSCLNLKKALKQTGQMENRRNSINQEKEGRLKYSKSEINLQRTSSPSKGRKFKKITLNLFKNKDGSGNNSNIFQQTWNSQMKQNKFGYSSFGSFTKSFHPTGKMSSFNWFNANQTQNYSKLRHFKKINNFNSANCSPVNKQETQTLAKIVQNVSQTIQLPVEDRISQEDIQKFNQIKNKGGKNNNQARPKLGSQIELQSKNKEIVKMKSRDNSEQRQKQKILVKTSEQLKQPKNKKNIINTINIKYYQHLKERKSVEGKNKRDSRNQSPNHHQEQPDEQINKEHKVIKAESAQNQSSLSHQQTKLTKNYKASRKSTILEDYNDQIQQINWAKKKTNSPPYPKNVSQIYQQERKTEDQILPLTNNSELSKSLLTQSFLPKKIKKQNSLLPQDQNIFYVSHFQFMLKYIQQHKIVKIKDLPFVNNLTYLLNLMYYKTLLEHRSNDTVQKYDSLITLLKKKQIKVPQQMKQRYLSYRVTIDDLWKSSKHLKNMQKQLINPDNYKQTKATAYQTQLQQFLLLSKEPAAILQQILTSIAKFIQSNKSILIQTNQFLTLLQFNFLIATTIILLLQRTNFYSSALKAKSIDPQQYFKLRYKNRVDEWLLSYRKRLNQNDIARVSASEELTYLRGWTMQYQFI